MDYSQICFILLVVLGFNITYIYRYIKMNRLRENMNDIQSEMDFYRSYIINKCEVKNAHIIACFDIAYPHYITWLNAQYANAGVPKSCGGQWLYNACKLKIPRSFFTITFYEYLSKFFRDTYIQKTNEEYKLLEKYEHELKIIYQTTSRLYTNLH